MPELPEVETVVRTLRPLISGRLLGRAVLTCPKLLREAPPGGLAALEGRRVEGVRRRGKMVLVDCGALSLVFHLKMTGRLLVVRAGAPSDKHTHLAIPLAGQGPAAELRFHDVRKFGFLRCLASEGLDAAPELAVLGPDPLEIGPEEFRDRLRRRRGRIKSVLLDQSFLAGVGNIYADEALFGARIHPLARADRLRAPAARALREELRAVLARSIEAKGTSLSDYVDAEGRSGGFQRLLRAYGREGEPCVRCGAAIRRIRVGARSAWFCPRCQRRSRPAERE